MNSTVININDNTTDFGIREITKKLIANRGKLFKAMFTKKDGSLRTMIFSVNTNWNPLNGIETTKSGEKMVETKCANNMATVTEKVLDACGECLCLRPRTLNLATITSLEVL